MSKRATKIEDPAAEMGDAPTAEAGGASAVEAKPDPGGGETATVRVRLPEGVTGVALEGVNVKANADGVVEVSHRHAALLVESHGGVIVSGV